MDAMSDLKKIEDNLYKLLYSKSFVEMQSNSAKNQIVAIKHKTYHVRNLTSIDTITIVALVVLLASVLIGSLIIESFAARGPALAKFGSKTKALPHQGDLAKRTLELSADVKPKQLHPSPSGIVDPYKSVFENNWRALESIAGLIQR